MLLRNYPKVLAVISVYSLTYPAREALQRISPKIPSPNGVPTAIFFWYMFTPGFVLVAGAAYLLLVDRGAIGKLRATIVSSVLVAFTVAIYQTRTAYLQFVGIAVFLFLYSRRNAHRWFAAVLVLILRGCCNSDYWQFRSRAAGATNLVSIHGRSRGIYCRHRK